MNNHSSHNLPTAVAIDIGTQNIKVLIGRIHAPDHIEVYGIGTAVNKGMSKGQIKHMDKVVAAIKEAIAIAEDKANCRIHTAWVAIPSPELKSINTVGEANVENEEVSTIDIYHTLESAKADHLLSDYYLVNSVSQGFEVDEQPEWVDQPVGMVVRHLEGHYHLMMLPIRVMQNIERALKATGVGVEQLVVSSLATAQAGLLPEEREFGVCMIDIGAGTTDINVYLENRLILSRTLSVGGENVTRDIALVFNTSMEQAERLKVRFGNLDRKSLKSAQMIQLPASGDDMGLTLSWIELYEVINARYEEILNAVRQVLEESGTMPLIDRGIVLTGEASQIEGLPEMAMRLMGLKVQLANAPKAIRTSKVNEVQLNQPIYTTAAGLLIYSQLEQARQAELSTAAEQAKPLEWISNPWKRFLDRLKQVI